MNLRPPAKLPEFCGVRHKGIRLGTHGKRPDYGCIPIEPCDLLCQFQNGTDVVLIAEIVNGTFPVQQHIEQPAEKNPTDSSSF